MTPNIPRFIAEKKPPTPCLVVDLDVMAHNYERLHKVVPLASIFYAVKANPATDKVGDRIIIEAAGAYTTTYSSVAFSGIPPLKGYYI